MQPRCATALIRVPAPCGVLTGRSDAVGEHFLRRSPIAGRVMPRLDRSWVCDLREIAVYAQGRGLGVWAARLGRVI